MFSDFDYMILRNENCEVTDPERIIQILRNTDDHLTVRHQGVVKTYERIKRQYYWKKVKESIEEYMCKCDICQQSKTNFKPNKSPMVIKFLHIFPRRVVSNVELSLIQG